MLLTFACCDYVYVPLSTVSTVGLNEEPLAS